MRTRHSRSTSWDETNLATVCVSLAAVAIGFGMFLFAELNWFSKHPRLESVLDGVAGLVLATGLLSVAWEWLGRRRFALELFSLASLRTDVVGSGLQTIDNKYLEFDWEGFFEGARRVDIVALYASTWRKGHLNRLKGPLAKKRCRVRFFLPDPNDAAAMLVLGKRLAGIPPNEAEAKVRAAIADYTELGDSAVGTVEIWVRPLDTYLSMYRADRRTALTFYSHSEKRQINVPFLEVKGGWLGDFVDDEFKAVLAASTKIYG